MNMQCAAGHRSLALLAMFAVACGSSDGVHGAASGAGGSDSRADAGVRESGAGGDETGGNGGASAGGGSSGSDGGASAVKDSGPPDAPFERPPYEPQPGSCGFDAPAFCDTFETGPHAGGRAGELDPAFWSAVRGVPVNPPNLTEAFTIGPALLPACRSNLPDRVLPDSDALVCDPTATVPSRHLLIAAAAQNYGLSSYRIRQPFDFQGRTGTLKFDADLTNNGLGGWPAIAISADPSAAPSFDWEERGSGPRNGAEIEFVGGNCNTPHTLEVGFYFFRDYVQTSQRPSFDCDTPHVTTAPGSLNHVEIYLTTRHLEVWVSDASPDGVTFPNFHQLFATDIELPSARAYVNLIVRNHATLKYWVGSAWTVRWDNVGFDGPVVSDTREYSVPDSLTKTQGLDGCMSGGACRYRGEIIAEHPDDNTLCAPDIACKFDGEGRNVGYVVPRDDETPVALHVPGVSLDGATGARLVFAATYPWFDWNGVSKPPTAINLQYRLNGGAFHDRFVTSIEANAFTDFFPELGGAGHGAGLLNQVVDLDLAELKDGDNVLELRTSGTWTGEYRAAVTGVDLVLTTKSPK
jgi:hypothetical protein